MARAKKPDEVAKLAEQMLDVLGTRKSTLGPEAYPPTLGQLAELCGLSPEDDLVPKAVAKKAFKDKAKVMGKVGLESLVYFKEDEATVLASRMLRILESQRELGDDHYPMTFRRLAEEAEIVDKTMASKVAKHESMASKATFASTGKFHWDSPVFLNHDLDPRKVGRNQVLLRFAFEVSRDVTGKNPKLAFTPKQLATKLQKPLQKPFEDDLKSRIQRRDLPPNYAWLANKEPLIFLLDDLQPPLAARPEAPALAEAPRAVSAASTHDFAGSFREAFDRLDRDNGLSNNVKLVDLRRELAGVSRGEFDAGLRQLRIAREFSLDSHEGLLRPLTPEEREAGISEAGSLLVYVSRR